ncbi:hypothetical protein GTA08_BOTSDO09334 [Neofusicoccum parvum]|nr:hypothetical protein GTA08_BOTSDO09334 [Neofusicoccum parvum]
MLLLRILEGGQTLDPENHVRIADFTFSSTTIVSKDRSTKMDRIIKMPAFFDKGFKNTHYNLMSLRVLDELLLGDSPVKLNELVMFDQPTTGYDIVLLDGRPLEVLGYCTIKWWANDRPCAGKEIWVDNNFMKSEFLIISRDAIHPVVISWETMVTEKLLQPTGSCAGGSGGLHPQPPPSNEEERKKKKAQQQAKQAQERAAQDKREKKRKK